MFCVFVFGLILDCLVGLLFLSIYPLAGFWRFGLIQIGSTSVTFGIQLLYLFCPLSEYLPEHLARLGYSTEYGMLNRHLRDTVARQQSVIRSDPIR